LFIEKENISARRRSDRQTIGERLLFALTGRLE
jgi:hypothetical protein